MNIWQEIKKLFVFDFRFSMSNIPALVVLALIYPAYKLLPAECGYENGLVENYQLMLLFFGCFIWVLAPKYRKLFILVALIFLVMAGREMSFGRVLFYAVPGVPNTFAPWSEVWYEPYLFPAALVYGAGCTVFFFAGKIYKQIYSLLAESRIPVWNMVLFVVLSIGTNILDRHCESMLIEEIVEFSAYTTLFMTVALYAFNPVKR